MKANDKAVLRNALKILDNIDIGVVNKRGSEVKSGPLKLASKDEKYNIPSYESAEANVDEGSPSKSGKYNGMDFVDILKVALGMEANAIEIGLALSEKCPPKYKATLIEITNDENDHSQLYIGMINDLEERK